MAGVFFSSSFFNCNKCVTSFFFGSHIFSNLVCSQNILITEWKVSKLSSVSPMSFMGTALFLHLSRQARFLLIPNLITLRLLKLFSREKSEKKILYDPTLPIGRMTVWRLTVFGCNLWVPDSWDNTNQCKWAKGQSDLIVKRPNLYILWHVFP